MGAGRPPLFKGTQLTTTTIAVPVPIVAGCVGLHVSWLDATTAASFVLEVSSYNAEDASVGAGGAGTKIDNGSGNAFLAGAAAQFWADSGVTIAAVAAGAAGSFLVNATNLRQQRARLLITSTAACSWEIYQGIQDV
jgi:hypothetical protein